MVGVDIYETGVGHIHGGHKYVVGFHDAFSGLTRVYLLKRKSDAPVAYKMYYAWCSTHRVYVKRFNTDNAGELSGEAVRAWARDLRHPCRITNMHTIGTLRYTNHDYNVGIRATHTMSFIFTRAPDYDRRGAICTCT